MVTNSDFNFGKNKDITLELPFSEHVEELRQRIFHIFCTVLVLTCAAFFEVKVLVKLLELPVNNVKFLQLAPGEYFVSTVKISFYTGLLFGSPFAIGQLILFLLPGLTKKRNQNCSSTFIRLFMPFWFRTIIFILCINTSSP
jgi:sec-independent protein translocase protein TatC